MPRYQTYVGDALETGMFEEKCETNASKARGSSILDSPAESFVAKRKSVAQTEDALLE